VALDTRTTLLDALREHLHLTGTMKGCDHGQCGACTVLINDRRINSCLTLAVMHQGDDVVTIEGLGSPADLHPLQAAFVEFDGFQCGYCTPGQICSAVGMLSEALAISDLKATTVPRLLMKPDNTSVTSTGSPRQRRPRENSTARCWNSTRIASIAERCGLRPARSNPK
jgi:aerobic-type carbon monoxide dehydrogenase small subunit (CoxS/CutS family)